MNLDLALFRGFPIGERCKLEFRGECTKSTNTPHCNNPKAKISAANFLAATSAVADQRQLRSGLRFSW